MDINKKGFKRYELITYDVWGNKKDGFEVNNAFSTEEVLVITEDATDRDIIKGLKTIGFIKKGVRYSSIDIDGEDGYSLYLTYTAGTWYPLCELRCID